MSTPPEPHVLIIGAGLTGLLIAHGLNKLNIAYTIFEREEKGQYRSKEWSMGIHWSVPLLEKLLPQNLYDRLVPEATVDPTLDYGYMPCNGSRIYDGMSGEVLKELGGEGKLVRVSRRKLRGLILEGVEVKYAHVLRGVSEGEMVEAVFENGLKYSGTVVVGCDGPRSVVRKSLFQSHPEEAEAKALEGIVHLGNTFKYATAEQARFVRSAHPVWSMALHPDIFTYLCVQDVPDPNISEDWTFFLFVCWRGEKPENLDLKELKRLAQDKAKGLKEDLPFRRAIEWIPEGVELGYADVSYWVARMWEGKGRVTLAGDAGHPMPPYRGQGLNHAIQDAFNFVEMMKKVKEGGEQRVLVEEYSREMVERGADETKLSMKNAYMLLAYDDFKESPYMKHGLSKQ